VGWGSDRVLPHFIAATRAARGGPHQDEVSQSAQPEQRTTQRRVLGDLCGEPALPSGGACFLIVRPSIACDIEGPNLSVTVSEEVAFWSCS